jgi:hypothetical protein
MTALQWNCLGLGQVTLVILWWKRFISQVTTG